MALVKRYHFFVDSQYRLWAQVIGTYTDGALVWRYAPSDSTQVATIGKLASNGRTLKPADGSGFDYTLTPPRAGEGFVAQPPPADRDALVETDTLPKYDLKNVQVGTPPIGTTPPPTPPPPTSGWEWSPEKDAGMRAWALSVDQRLTEDRQRITALEGGQVVTPPVVPPPPTGPVVGRYPVRFVAGLSVPSHGGKLQLSSVGWFSKDQTNVFGEAVPKGLKFALTEIHYSDKNRDYTGASGVSFGGDEDAGLGIYTARNHNPEIHFDVPPVFDEGFVVDGWVSNHSESGPTNVIIRVHGWYFVPGHEPDCLRG